MAECEVCGADSLPSFGDRLDQHLADYNDPHKTLDLVPKTYFGYVAPEAGAGYRAGDWYIDLVSGLGYANTGSSWVEAFRKPTELDLSGYALKADLESYAKLTDLTGYATTITLANYVEKSAFDSLTNSAVLKAELSSLVDAAGFIRSGALSSYVTKTDLTTNLSGYVKTGTLAPYLKSEDAEAVYAKKTDVSDELALKVTGADVDGDWFDERGGIARSTADGVYATKLELETGLSGCAKSGDIAGFLDREAADKLYLPRGFEGGSGIRSLEYASVLGAGHNKYGYNWYGSVSFYDSGPDASGNPILLATTYECEPVPDLASKVSAGDSICCVRINLSDYYGHDVIYNFNDVVKSSRDYIGRPEDKFTLIILECGVFNGVGEYDPGTSIDWSVHLDFSFLPYHGSNEIYLAFEQPFVYAHIGAPNIEDELLSCRKLAKIIRSEVVKIGMSFTLVDDSVINPSAIYTIGACSVNKASLMASLCSSYDSNGERAWASPSSSYDNNG